MKKLLAILLMGGVGYYIYNRSKDSAKELVQSMTFTPNDISIDTSHPLNPKVVLQFEVNNPTNQPFTITKIYGTITNNGQQLATINNNDNVHVGANLISNLPIQINIDAFNLATSIANGDLGYTFLFVGYAMAGLIKIPFNKELTIQLPNWL